MNGATKLKLTLLFVALTPSWSLTSRADDRAAASSTPSALVAEIHNAGDYPDSLTLHEAPEATPQWLRDLADAFVAFIQAVAPLLKVALYVALGGFAVYLMYRLYSHHTRREEKAEAVVGPAPVESRRPTVDEWLPAEDPEDLAALGQFERAILLLLLHALKRVGWGASPSDRARTAREVLGAISETDRRHPALGALVECVEPIRFGGVETDATHYHSVRVLFLQLCEVT